MRHTKAYMRLVEPGQKPDTTVSDKLRRHVNQYIQKIQAAVETGTSADEAFKKIKPDVSRMKPDDLIGLLWENQYIGTWELPKGSVNLLYALEGILQKAIYTAAVQWWGKQKTERKRQTDPGDKTVVKDTSQDDVGTKVETPAKAAAVKEHVMIKHAGHLYRATTQRQADVVVSVDYENNATEWWESGGRELWEQFAGDARADEAVMSDQQVRQFLLKAKRIPGWNGGPQYAPNPIMMQAKQRPVRDLTFDPDRVRVPAWALTHTALSTDGYARAVERANDAACRSGLLGAIKAIKLRIKRTDKLHKLDGIDRLVQELYREISDAMHLIDNKY